MGLRARLSAFGWGGWGFGLLLGTSESDRITALTIQQCEDYRVHVVLTKHAVRDRRVSQGE